jgi:hypothetical protein
MFAPGNKLGQGRPKISLTKPELLLPAVLAKGNINWAADFVRLYKCIKDNPELTIQQKNQLKFFMDFMPYLCTKVQLKEIMSTGGTSPADSRANAAQTSKLLQALEAENNGPSATS